MDEILMRKEQRLGADKKIKALGQNMKTALSAISMNNEGLQVLRYLLYKSNFLAPLMGETPEGVNKDVMIANEANRQLYLSLRAHMDRATIMRIELPEETSKEG